MAPFFTVGVDLASGRDHSALASHQRNEQGEVEVTEPRSMSPTDVAQWLEEMRSKVDHVGS